MKGQKRWLGLMLALCLCLGLAVPAAAYERLDQMPDVFQGDGVYITATEIPIPEGWSVHKGAPQGIHEGLITVIRDENIQDEDGFYTGTRTVMNWVDLEGNLFDFSDWENPPILFWEVADYTFHDGLCYFYDSEVGACGYIDTSGNVVIAPDPQYGHVDFENGFIVQTDSVGNGQTLVDKTGNVVFSLEELGWDGAIVDVPSDGVFPYRGYLDANRNTYFVGYLNLQGEPVITLYSGDRSGYDRDQGLSFASPASFSEGYAALSDRRGGGTYPSYIIIDRQGNEVLTLEPEAPFYISSVGYGGAQGIHNGKFWVSYRDTTPGLSYDDATYGVLMDLEGNVLYRATAPAPTAVYGYFDNGVAVRRANNDALVIDIEDNIIVPRFTVNGAVFTLTIEFNEDNQTLASLDDLNGNITYYVMEVHDGTYTGSGRVYDAATGTIRQGGGTQPTDPEPSADQPSSWAQAQVNEAISAGLVPGALQSSYTTPATRSEFCALAAELYETVLDTEITERATFTDTTDVNVEKMAGLGVVNGVGNGQFNPSGQITRQEAAALLSRLAQVMGHPLSGQSPDYADAAEISAWAAEAVGQMQAAGIMNGIEGNRFAPRDPYTREQSIMTVLRLYNIVK